MNATVRNLSIKHLCQFGVLAWIVGAIVIYPSAHARREREAKALVARLGGRCHAPLDSMAEYLPAWIVKLIGFENLYPVRSVCLTNSDVCDADIETLLHLTNLEQINLCGCSRVTHSGLARLRQMPRMKLVWVDGMGLDEVERHVTGKRMAAAGQ